MGKAKGVGGAFLTILSIALLLGATFGCKYFSPLIGKWQDTRSQDEMEFTRDGKVILRSAGYVVSGEYELVGSDVIKIRLEGLAGGMLTAFGVDTWQYQISGDTMTLKGAGSTSTYRRVRASTQPTPTNTRRATPKPTATPTPKQPTPLPRNTTATSKVTLVSPNGGELWRVGETVTIRWTSVNVPASTAVSIVLEDGSAGRGYVIGSTTNTGSFKWTVTSQVIGAKSRIRIDIPSHDISLRSSADFTISSR